MFGNHGRSKSGRNRPISSKARTNQSRTTYLGEQIVVISLHFMFFNNFRHIKARKILSIDKIGWFDDMGIKSMSVKFN